MFRRIFSIAALTVLSAAVASPAMSADVPIAARPRVVVHQGFEMPRIYITDRGPVYSGPGIYTNPTVVLPRRMARYPYVGRTYAYRAYAAPLRVRY